jgi:hypothetical protein
MQSPKKRVFKRVFVYLKSGIAPASRHTVYFPKFEEKPGEAPVLWDHNLLINHHFTVVHGMADNVIFAEK